jgi:hypothetical protein
VLADLTKGSDTAAHFSALKSGGHVDSRAADQRREIMVLVEDLVSDEVLAEGIRDKTSVLGLPGGLPPSAP